MNVELESCTPDALNLLLKTKCTRLSHDEDPISWGEEKRAEHLEYMRDTIKSSWEFVDYVFKITAATRVFTHQLVRTRTGSYAQQTMRSSDVRDQEILRPAFGNEEMDAIWDKAVNAARWAYGELIDRGAAVQDARGLLPENITTSIFAKFNLRTIHDTAKTRLCTRTQGEYQDIFRLMRLRVIEVHPWAEEFIQPMCVADGICAFPRYGKKECPFYDPRMDLTELKADTKRKFWSMRYESAPRATEGKTA